MRVVRVRAGALIDRVEFEFSDGHVSVFGGDGGTPYPDFILQEGEHIVGVRGRGGAFVDSFQVVTSTGRESVLYGGSGGAEAYDYNLGGAPVGGLSVINSARGWLARVGGLWPLDEVVVAPAVAEASRARRSAASFSIVTTHRSRVRSNLFLFWAWLLSASCVVAASLLPVVTTVLQGPVPLETWLEHAAAPLVHQGMLRRRGEGFEWPPVGLPQRMASGGLAAALSEEVALAASKAGGLVLVPSLPAPGEPWGDSVEITGRPAWQASDLWVDSWLGAGKRQWLLLPTDTARAHQSGRPAEGDSGGARGPEREAAVASLLRRHFTMILVKAALAEGLTSFLAEASAVIFRFSAGAAGTATAAPFVRVGLVRALRPEHYGGGDAGLGLPPFYVDSAPDPLLLLAAFVGSVAAMLAAGRGLVRLALSPGADPVRGCLAAYVAAGPRFGPALAELAAEVEAEVAAALEARSTGGSDGAVGADGAGCECSFEGCRFVCTANWFVKLHWRGMDAVHLDDARVAEVRLHQRFTGAGERVEVVRATVLRGDPGTPSYSFPLELPREGFSRLQSSFVARHRSRLISAARQSYLDGLSAAWDSGSVEVIDDDDDGGGGGGDTPACLGDCGATANVRIRKLCLTCPERDECRCEPAWCHRCLFKWWEEKNTVRLDAGQYATRAWQARCPTCRVLSCRALPPSSPRSLLALLPRAAAVKREGRIVAQGVGGCLPTSRAYLFGSLAVQVFFCLDDVVPTGPLSTTETTPDQQVEESGEASGPSVESVDGSDAPSTGGHHVEEGGGEKEEDEEDEVAKLTERAIALSLEEGARSQTQLAPIDAVSHEADPETRLSEEFEAASEARPIPENLSELRRRRLSRFSALERNGKVTEDKIDP